VINVETARIEAQFSYNLGNNQQVAFLLSGNQQNAPAVPSQPAAQTPAVPAPAAPVTYKVGDTGPAGGLIFYDKGNNTGGWRYLEAAPATTERNLTWGLFGTTVNGTGVELGAGKQNTMAIVQSLMSSGEFNAAVYYCDALDFGGYDDWYLPSKGELAMMYVNLKQKGLGGFSSDWYWSSSDVNNDAAWKQEFSDGSQFVGNNRGTSKKDSHKVRAIRQF
jgi:hypothetical protein